MISGHFILHIKVTDILNSQTVSLLRILFSVHFVILSLKYLTSCKEYTVSDEILTAFPGNEARMPALTALVQHNAGSYDRHSKQGKNEVKGIHSERKNETDSNLQVT